MRTSASQNDGEKNKTLYQQLGGIKTFRQLADVFYARLERDPLLRTAVFQKKDVCREQSLVLLARSAGPFYELG